MSPTLANGKTDFLSCSPAKPYSLMGQTIPCGMAHETSQVSWVSLQTIYICCAVKCSLTQSHVYGQPVKTFALQATVYFLACAVCMWVKMATRDVFGGVVEVSTV